MAARARPRSKPKRKAEPRAQPPPGVLPLVYGYWIRVLVADHVIPRGNAPDRGKLMDLNMFTLLRGKERTRVEFRDLFAAAGLRLRRVVPTAATLCVLEAVRA